MASEQRQKFMSEIKQWVIKDESLTEQTSLKALQDSGVLDSIARAEVLSVVDEIYGVDMWETKIMDFDNFGSFLDHVEAKTKA